MGLTSFRPVESLEGRTLLAGDPAVTVSSRAVMEPTGSAAAFVDFDVALDQPAPAVIRLNYATADGGARAGSDYVRTAGTITFAPGEASKVVRVPIRPDVVAEADETLFLNVTLFTGTAALVDPQGVATILANSSQAAATATPLTLTGDAPALTFLGCRGKPVRVTLDGPGAGTLTLSPGGGAAISLTGTTADSSLTIVGRTVLHSMSVTGSLGRIAARHADLAGDLTVSGSLEALTLHNATGNGDIRISGSSPTPLAVSLNNLCDVDLVAPALGRVRINQWHNTDTTTNVLRAGSIESLTVRGGFHADVEADSIGGITIGGSLTESSVLVAQRIGAVRAGGMLDSRVLVGVAAGASPPDALSDFTATSSIGSVTISGNSPGVFRDTVIAAREIGPVVIGRVHAGNGGTTFGVFADRIAAMTGSSFETGGFGHRNLDAPNATRAELDFRIQTF